MVTSSTSPPNRYVRPGVVVSRGLWVVHEDSYGFAFDFTAPVFGDDPYKRLRVDRQFLSGSILVSRECFPDGTPLYPLEYPLDDPYCRYRFLPEPSAVEKVLNFYD